MEPPKSSDKSIRDARITYPDTGVGTYINQHFKLQNGSLIQKLEICFVISEMIKMEQSYFLLPWLVFQLQQYIFIYFIYYILRLWFMSKNTFVNKEFIK